MSPDVLVIGAGGVGSQVLAALAQRGIRAHGLDRFAPPHDRGSTHGETRIIRLAYLEHPDYVPLLRRAYEGWAALEAQTGRTLYEERGLLQVGPPDGHVVQGVLESARIHGLEVDSLTAAEARARFAGFAIPDDLHAVFERQAGFLWVERCVEATLDVARAHGATLETGLTVHGWRAEGDGVVVDTSAGERRAARLVICPGAWAPELLHELGVPFSLRRKTLHWYAAPPDPSGPCWLFDVPDGGVIYGFPALGAHADAPGTALHGGSLKAAQHSGGETITDPLGVDRTIRPSDHAAVDRFLAKYRPPYARAPHTRGAVCMYTMTPDEHFVVDHHPRSSRVVVVAGLSGHGFKLTTALGAIAAELAVDGRTGSPVAFLGLARFRRPAAAEAPPASPT